MKDFLTKNFAVLLIALLIVFLYFKGTFTPLLPQVPKKDTVYAVTQIEGKPVQSVPNIYVNIPPTNIPQSYKPDTSYQGLIRQYQAVIAELLAKNVYKREFPLDSFGKLNLTDTISGNKIVTSISSFHLNIPKEIITITNPYKPKAQVYYGVELTSPINQTLGIQQFSVGTFLKDKRDQVIGLTLGYNFQARVPVASLKYYHKLSFHK